MKIVNIIFSLDYGIFKVLINIIKIRIKFVLFNHGLFRYHTVKSDSKFPYCFITLLFNGIYNYSYGFNDFFIERRKSNTCKK